MTDSASLPVQLSRIGRLHLLLFLGVSFDLIVAAVVYSYLHTDPWWREFRITVVLLAMFGAVWLYQIGRGSNPFQFVMLLTCLFGLVIAAGGTGIIVFILFTEAPGQFGVSPQLSSWAIAFAAATAYTAYGVYVLLRRDVRMHARSRKTVLTCTPATSLEYGGAKTQSRDQNDSPRRMTDESELFAALLKDRPLQSKSSVSDSEVERAGKILTFVMKAYVAASALFVLLTFRPENGEILLVGIVSVGMQSAVFYSHWRGDLITHMLFIASAWFGVGVGVLIMIFAVQRAFLESFGLAIAIFVVGLITASLSGAYHWFLNWPPLREFLHRQHERHSLLEANSKDRPR